MSVGVVPPRPRFGLALCLFVAVGGACSAIPTVPGRVVDKPGLIDAQVLIWRGAFGRTDASPLVYVVEGDALTCSSDVNGTPGFDCPTVGCRQGCTGSPWAVHVAYGSPWSATTLAHEDMHALLIRDGLAALLEKPRTFEAMMAIGDGKHAGPEWQPGGKVDQANQLLREHGL